MNRLLVIVIMLGAAVLSGRAEIRFNGFTVVDGAPKFSLSSTDDQTSKWVSVGQSFANCRVLGFDAGREILTILEGDRRVELRMVFSPIQEVKPSGEIPAGNVVRVNEVGAISVNGVLYPVEELAALAARLDKNAVVRIEMDKNARAASGIALLNAIRAAGITRVTMATDPSR